MKKNNVLAEKLKDVRLNYNDYGRLPLRLDVLTMKPPEGKVLSEITNQYDKLWYLRKHLQKINEYIKSKTTEPINVWDGKNNVGISTRVLSELKGHNNETGGISAYFYNLQMQYDREEEGYDVLEKQYKLPDEVKTSILDFQKEREEKRKTRSKERKILVKDLKKDGKGFLVIDVGDEPEKKEELKQEQKKDTNISADAENIVKKETEEIKKSTKKVGIYIAGITVFITAIAVAVAVSKKE